MRAPYSPPQNLMARSGHFEVPFSCRGGCLLEIGPLATVEGGAHNLIVIPLEPRLGYSKDEGSRNLASSRELVEMIF